MPCDQDQAGGARNLRELRAARRRSHADLAGRLDVSRQTVNAIETGRDDPSLLLAVKIAELFESSIESLFLPAEDPPATPSTSWQGVPAGTDTVLA